MLNLSECVPATAVSDPNGTAALPALQIRGLSKCFGSFVALKDIDLNILPGEFVCFLGPSGCGKTTLLRAIAGLDPQDEGTIHQNGHDISRLPVSRRDFGIVFQSYALFPNLTVERNIGYGLRGARVSRQQRKARVAELLEMVGLPGQAAKYPAQLSGGQQQRVALARALAPSPGLLLLDEPLSALDAQVRLHLRDQLRALQRSLGVTTIMVTHDQDEALATADRIVVMRQGAIEQVGTPEEVFSRPASPFVAGFFGDMNFIPAVASGPARVAAGKASFAVPRTGMEAGAQLSLCIRPADITVDRQPLGAPNTLDAVIEALSFRGNFHRLRLFSPRIDQHLDAEVPIDAFRGLGATEGSSVTISLPPPKLHIFPQAS